MLAPVHMLERFGVCGTRVNYNQLSASQFSLLEIEVFVFVKLDSFNIRQNSVSCDGDTATHRRDLWKLERRDSVEAAEW